MASGNTSSEKSRSGPWAGMQQSLLDLDGRAGELYGQGPYQYGPDRQARLDPASEQAFGMAEARATGGSDLTRAAQGEAQRTLEGQYLNPESNPGLQRFSEIGARNIGRSYYSTINSLGSRLEAAGRTGSGAQATGTKIAGENLATGLADYNAQLYGGAYESERGRMVGAMGQANDLANQDYRDIGALRSVGEQRQQQRQLEIDDLVARFQQQQYASAEKLAEFSTMIGDPVMEQRASGKSQGWGALWG